VDDFEKASLPFYKLQTTNPIPYNALDVDVKTAIENLSLACKVDVSRAVEKNGYSWDVTFTSQRDVNNADFTMLSVMKKNNAELGSGYSPDVIVKGLQKIEIGELATGTSTFFRISGINSFGTGSFVNSVPASLQPSIQPPSPPKNVFIEAVSDSEILVQFEPSINTGGAPVTNYYVEYDSNPDFTSGPNN
jgi:hypothetical protein